MNILMYDSELDNENKWATKHYISELRGNGHKIDPIGFSIEDLGTEKLNEVILNKIENNKYDLFFSTCAEDRLFISTLKKIKNNGIKTVLFCPDNLLIPYKHKKICKYYDLVWLSSIETEHMFKKWGARTIFMPYASNPNNYFYVPQKKYIDRVCFVGTAYGSRVNLINTLIQNGIKVDLYEAPSSPTKVQEVNTHTFWLIFNYLGFKEGRKIFVSGVINRLLKPKQLDENNPNLNRIIGYSNIDKMRELYSKYKLCLSASSAENTAVLKNQLDVVNLRSFEVPSCGGIQLIQKTKELQDYFVDGKNIAFYNNSKDMAVIAKKYLELSDDEIRKMKLDSIETIKENHTWSLRFNEIFELLNLNNE